MSTDPNLAELIQQHIDRTGESYTQIAERGKISRANVHGPHHQTHRPDVCAWIDCAAPARSRGVCPRHYDRTLRAGRRMLRRAVS